MSASEVPQEFSIPPRVVWPTPIVVGAVVLMMILLLSMTMEVPVLVHTRELQWWQPVLAIGPAIVTVVVWALFEVRSTRYFQPSLDRPLRWTFHHLRRLPLLIVGFIVVTYGVRALFGYFNASRPSMYLIMFVHESLKVALLYLCWLALTFGVVSFARMRQQAEHLLNVQKSLVETKLIQLKGQLRPHFLFNTLNTISAVMQVDVARADRLLTQLGDLLRASLDASESNIVPVDEELELLRQYAGIMQERFAGRVNVEWRIDPHALGAAVPAMLLQPLLENAFKHGIERSTGVEQVAIGLSRAGDRLCATIFNTGSKLSATYVEGWGLRNTRERLQLLYGTDAQLALHETPDGVSAEVSLPWKPA